MPTDFLSLAQSMVGTPEGSAKLTDYLQTGGQNLDPVDMAWCAAFINATLEQSGYGGTNSKLAKSFLNYGTAVEPGGVQPGDIGVFNRGDPNSIYGHAGIVKSYDPQTGQVTLVSGNVGNRVSEQTMDAKLALAFRRPQVKAAAQQMAAEGYTPDQIKKALLDTIAGPESAGAYDVMYGGDKFTDYSKHPGVYTPIESGPNKGKTSSAAGKYQFLESTWNDQAKKLGLTDFSPENQDKAAWNLAAETYANATKGGDLTEALQSGDPARINAAADILKKTWTSMPGGIEQQGYGTGTFADAYAKALGQPTTAQGPNMPAPGTAGAKQIAANKTQAKTGNQDKYQKAASAAFKGFADLKAPVLGAGGNAPQLPTQAPLPMDSMPIVSGAAGGSGRDDLALLMQRLNTQRLWG